MIFILIHKGRNNIQPTFDVWLLTLGFILPLFLYKTAQGHLAGNGGGEFLIAYAILRSIPRKLHLFGIFKLKILGTRAYVSSTKQ